MAYLMVGLVIVVWLLAMLAFGGRAMAQKAQTSTPDAGAAAVAKTNRRSGTGAPTYATRATLAARLKALAAAPRPPRKILSAECYEPPAQYHRAEYVCPKDGERTVYAIDGTPPTDSETLTFLNEKVPAMRRMVAAMEGLDVSLDESELCRKCVPIPRPLGQPEVVLVIRYPGEKPRVVRGPDPQALQLVVEFLAGRDTHHLEGPDTAPLADYQQQIAQILGIEVGGSDGGTP